MAYISKPCLCEVLEYNTTSDEVAPHIHKPSTSVRFSMQDGTDVRSPRCGQSWSLYHHTSTSRSAPESHEETLSHGQGCVRSLFFYFLGILRSFILCSFMFSYLPASLQQQEADILSSHSLGFATSLLQSSAPLRCCVTSLTSLPPSSCSSSILP